MALLSQLLLIFTTFVMVEVTELFIYISVIYFRNLLANPFNCDCRLSWLGEWLRSRQIVTGNPRCQNPAFLREIPLQDVAKPDFLCDKGNASFQAYVNDYNILRWDCKGPPSNYPKNPSNPCPSRLS